MLRPTSDPVPDPDRWIELTERAIAVALVMRFGVPFEDAVLSNVTLD